MPTSHSHPGLGEGLLQERLFLRPHPTLATRPIKCSDYLTKYLLSIYCVLRILSLSESMALSKRGLPPPHRVFDVYHCWSIAV